MGLDKTHTFVFLHNPDMKVSDFNYCGCLLSKLQRTSLRYRDHCYMLRSSGRFSAAFFLLFCYEHILTDTGINLDKVMNNFLLSS